MGFIVNVNKQKGWTSFDVVNKLKHIYNTKKVGHLGTLDPMAEGVLPVVFNKATKLFDLYLNKQKEYIAVFKANIETDSLDSDGKIVKETKTIIDEEKLRSVLKNFVGVIEQIPPQYSSKKVDGKRAYELARNNIEFSLKPKKITIFKLDYLGKVSEDEYKFFIQCSAGTYIRSLGRDIFYALNSCATMTKLTRVKAGPFAIDESFTIKEIESDPLTKKIGVEKAIDGFLKIVVCDDDAKKLLNGMTVILKKYQKDQKCAVFHNGILLGVGEIFAGKLKISINLYEGE